MKYLDEQTFAGALMGDPANVEGWVNRGANINYTNPEGTSAMFNAAWEGNLEAMEEK